MKSFLAKLAKPLLLLALSLALSACTLPLIGPKKAGVQITSTPQANVFMDNQSLGQTPIIKEDLPAGSHTVKISSADSTIPPWEGQITLNPNTMTIIDRHLSNDPNQATGHLLSFEKLSDKNAAEVSIITAQNNISVAIDGSPSGFTPLKSNSINPGAHVFLLSSPGFQDKTIKASVQAGYRLIVNAQLATQQVIPPLDSEPSVEEPEATPSATPTTSPTPTDTITPLPKQSTASAVPKPYVEILPTPTNFLRVRDAGRLGAAEVAKVNPGDRFPHLDTQNNWYQIEYLEGKKGWISGTYAKLVE